MTTGSMPKMFLIHASKRGTVNKSGFLRLRSYQTKDGEIGYEMTFVRWKTEASRFLNYDNVKEISLEYMRRYGLEYVKIVDYSSGKATNVREPK